jgi:hypothetical protein
MSNKRHRELFLFERFVEAIGLEFKIIDSSGEAPDLIVEHQGIRLGIEITEIFVSHITGDDGPQAAEGVRQRILRKARSIYESDGPPYVHVSVVFSAGADLRSVQRDETAKALAVLVRKQQPLRSDSHVVWRQDHVSGVPSVVSSVHMLTVPAPAMAHWAAPSAGWVTTFTSFTLQQAIDDKARLLPGYRRRAEHHWLIVVGDGWQPSRFARMGEQVDLTCLRSPFDRSFFFSEVQGKVHELGRS